MKVSRERAARNREAVVHTASRLFRAQGVGGVGIGDVMRASGLTHGGFYNQFASKEALAAEACAAALAKSAERWRALAGQADDPVRAIADDYLSARNRDSPEAGCALVGLCADAARQGGALAEAFGAGLETLAGIVQNAAPDMDRPATLARLAQMVGAVALARGVSDPALSDDIMAAARQAAGLDGPD